MIMCFFLLSLGGSLCKRARIKKERRWTNTDTRRSWETSRREKNPVCSLRGGEGANSNTGEENSEFGKNNHLFNRIFSLISFVFSRFYATGQTEQLVNQQILIDRLRSNFGTFHGTTSEATAESKTSGYLYNRPHSVPLIRHSCVHRASRKVETCCLLYRPRFKTDVRFQYL